MFIGGPSITAIPAGDSAMVRVVGIGRIGAGTVRIGGGIITGGDTTTGADHPGRAAAFS
jgi:hypothetical protein